MTESLRAVALREMGEVRSGDGRRVGKATEHNKQQ